QSDAQRQQRQEGSDVRASPSRAPNNDSSLPPCPAAPNKQHADLRKSVPIGRLCSLLREWSNDKLATARGYGLQDATTVEEKQIFNFLLAFSPWWRFNDSPCKHL